MPNFYVKKKERGKCEEKRYGAGQANKELKDDHGREKVS